MSIKIIDCTGDICPVPVIKLKKALKEATTGDSLQIIVDNDISLENVKKMLDDQGHFYAVVVNGTSFELEITVNETEQTTHSDDEWVVVLASDSMGSDEVLGRDLMKAYIFALTQLNGLPKAIAIYNSGAKLVSEDSPALNDLKVLEENGTRIMTCGICVKHYELENSLGVGEISNMYAIAELLAQAKKVVRP